VKNKLVEGFPSFIAVDLFRYSGGYGVYIGIEREVQPPQNISGGGRARDTKCYKLRYV